MALSPTKSADIDHRRHSSISRTLSKLKSSRRDEDVVAGQDGVGAAIRRGDVAISGPIPIAEEEDEDESGTLKTRAPSSGRSFPNSQTDLHNDSSFPGTLSLTRDVGSAKPQKLTRRSSENLLQLSLNGLAKSDRRKSQGSLMEEVAPDFPKPRKPRKFKAIVTKIFGASSPAQEKPLTASSETSLKSQHSEHVQLSPISTGPERLLASTSSPPSTSASPKSPPNPAAVAALEWPDSAPAVLESTRTEDSSDTLAKRIRKRHESMLSTLPALTLHKSYATSTARPYSTLHRSITVGSSLDHTNSPEYDTKQRSKSISTTMRIPRGPYSESIKRHKSEDGLNWRQSKFIEELSPVKSQQNLSNPDFTVLPSPRSIDTYAKLSARPATLKYSDASHLEARVEHLEKKMLELEKALEQARSRTNSVRNLSSPNSLRSPSELQERQTFSRDGSAAYTPTRQQEYQYAPLSGQLTQPYPLDTSQSCAIDQQSEGSNHDSSPIRDRRFRSLSTSTTIRVPPAQRRGSEPEQQETVFLTGLQYSGLINMIRDEQNQRKKLESQVMMLLKQLDYQSATQGLPTPDTATLPPLKPDTFPVRDTRHSPIISPRPIRPDAFSHFDSISKHERSSFATDDEGGLPESAFETSSTELGFGDDVDADADADADDANDNTNNNIPDVDSPVRTLSLSRLTISRPITSVAF